MFPVREIDYAKGMAVRGESTLSDTGTVSLMSTWRKMSLGSQTLLQCQMVMGGREIGRDESCFVMCKYNISRTCTQGHMVLTLRCCKWVPWKKNSNFSEHIFFFTFLCELWRTASCVVSIYILWRKCGFLQSTLPPTKANPSNLGNTHHIQYTAYCIFPAPLIILISVLLWWMSLDSIPASGLWSMNSPWIL